MEKNNKKRYMRATQYSGCILADYNARIDNENNVFAVNNNFESGVFNPDITKISLTMRKMN